MNTARKLELVPEFNCRLYNPDSDYKIAQKWWLQHNQSHIEHHFLPPTGAVFTKNGQPIAMAWIYLSNSPIAQMSWVVTKPKLGPKTRYFAVRNLLDTCEAMAKNAGYKMIQMFSDRPGLSRIAQISKYKMVRHHDFLVKYIETGDENDV